MSFTCQYCNKEFAQKGNSKRHEEICKEKKRVQTEKKLLEEKEKDRKILNLEREKFVKEREIEMIKLESEREIEKLQTELNVYKTMNERLCDRPVNTNIINIQVTPEMIPLAHYKIPPIQDVKKYIISRNYDALVQKIYDYNTEDPKFASIRSKDISRGKGICLNGDREWINVKHNEIGLYMQTILYNISEQFRQDSDCSEGDTRNKLEHLEKFIDLNNFTRNSSKLHKLMLKISPTFI